MEQNNSPLPANENIIRDPSDDIKTEADKKKKNRSKIIWIIIYIVLVGGVITYTAIADFNTDGKQKLDFTFGLGNWMLVICGFACVAAALAFETIKYIMMMRSLGEKVSVKAAFQTAALGKYYDCITPSGAGGQPFQIYNLYKFGYSNGASAAMPLAAFLFMQLAFVLLALLVFLFNGNVVDTAAIKVPAYIGVVMYALVPGFIVLFMIRPDTARKILLFVIRIGTKLKIVKDPDKTTASLTKSLEEYNQSMRLFIKDKKLLLKLAVFSLLYQIAMMSIPFFVLHAYNGTEGFFKIFCMTVFIYCAITIVPTPGNSGAAEASFYMIFSGLKSSSSFWAMMIWRLMSYYTFILIGLGIYAYNAVSVRLKSRRKT